jgi:hypothetical protein
MISHRHFPTLLGAIIGATLVLVYLWARLAMADAGPPVPVLDAGVVDRVVAADHAAPVVAAPPSVEPATIDDGLSLASWLWERWRTGQAGVAIVVALQALGLLAIRRWAWVSRALPRLTRGKALAAVSAFVGSLATVVPVALAGASVVVPLALAAITSVGVYLMPAPTQIAGETVPT